MHRSTIDPYYSIILSARARNGSGMVSPSAFAVLRLTTSSNLVGCSIGRSAGDRYQVAWDMPFRSRLASIP